MTPEQERWAEALAVMRQYGDGLSAFLTERCVTLAKAGDMAGVARWREIIHRCDQLRDGTTQ